MAKHKDDNLRRIEVDGAEFEWSTEKGLLLISGGPSLALWIESSLAGLMQGMQHMVGTERFNLAMQGGGRESVAGDWDFICQHPSFEEGLAGLGVLANTCGWGLWSIAALDRDRKTARFRVHNGWEALYQRALGVDWGSNLMAGKFAGLCGKLFGVQCWATQTKFQARGDDFDEFDVEQSDATVEGLIEELLTSDNATRADLAVALEKLERENTERKRAQQETQAQLALIEEQRRDLESLSSPIIQIWDGVLTVPVIGSLSSDGASALMDRLLTEIQKTGAQFALLDVTGVDTIDTQTASALLSIVRTAALLGSRCVITGMQPAVAQSLVQLGTDFSGIVTFATLRDGLEFCMNAMAKE